MIIATYKRPYYLKECFKSMISQKRQPDEIVVVTMDNDYKSKSIAKELTEKTSVIGITVINVDVSRLGIILAENRGLEVATGDVVCFIDDDGIALEDWLKRIERHFKDPKIGGVGGPVIPYIDGKPIFEKTDKVGKILWFGHVIDNFHKIPERPLYVDHLRGCNMAFKKEYLNNFDELLIGDAYRFEMDACLKVKKKSRLIIYDPLVRVYHYVAPRFDFGRIEDNVKIHNNVHNNTYVLLKYLSIPQKIIFLFYALIVGGYVYIPGFSFILGRCIKRQNTIFLKQIIPSLTGLIHGIRTYIKYKKLNSCGKA